MCRPVTINRHSQPSSPDVQPGDLGFTFLVPWMQATRQQGIEARFAIGVSADFFRDWFDHFAYEPDQRLCVSHIRLFFRIKAQSASFASPHLPLNARFHGDIGATGHCDGQQNSNDKRGPIAADGLLLRVRKVDVLASLRQHGCESCSIGAWQPRCRAMQSAFGYRFQMGDRSRIRAFVWVFLYKEHDCLHERAGLT